jgi:hypothetical protein
MDFVEKDCSNTNDSTENNRFKFKLLRNSDNFPPLFSKITLGNPPPPHYL